MITALAPLSSFLVIFAACFCTGLLWTGLTLFFIQQNAAVKRARSLDYAALLAAPSLGLVVFALIEAGALLVHAHPLVAEGQPLLAEGLLISAGLFMVVNLLPVLKLQRHYLIALCLLFGASAALVFSLSHDQLLFQGLLPLALDRGLATLFVFGAGALFLQFEKIDGSGMMGLLVLGVGILAVPVLIEAVRLLFVHFALPLGAPSTPGLSSLWFFYGVLLIGTGFGVIFWTFRGYSCFLSFEGRLAVGFLFAFFALQLGLYTSPFVIITLFLFYLFCYVFYPLVTLLFAKLSARYDIFAPPLLQKFAAIAGADREKRRALAPLSRRWPLPDIRFEGNDVLSLFLIQSLFIVLAALAYFWPLEVILFAVCLAAFLLWWLRWRSGSALPDQPPPD